MKLQKQLGAVKVELHVCRKELSEIKKKAERSEEEATKGMQTCYESDAIKFKALLEQLRVEGAKARTLSAREMLWKDLVKALSSQLLNPCAENETEIQVASAQLSGATAVVTNLNIRNICNRHIKVKEASLVAHSAPESKVRTPLENRKIKASSKYVTPNNTGSSSRKNKKENSAVVGEGNDPVNQLGLESSLSKCLQNLSILNENAEASEVPVGYNAAPVDDELFWESSISSSEDFSNDPEMWIKFLKAINEEAVGSLKMQLQLKEEQIRSMQKEQEETRAEATNNLMKLTDTTAFSMIITKKNQALQIELDEMRILLSERNAMEAEVALSHRNEREMWRKCYMSFKSLFQDIQVRLYLTKTHSPEHCRSCVFASMLTDNYDWTNHQVEQFDLKCKTVSNEGLKYVSSPLECRNKSKTDTREGCSTDSSFAFESEQSWLSQYEKQLEQQNLPELLRSASSLSRAVQSGSKSYESSGGLIKESNEEAGLRTHEINKERSSILDEGQHMTCDKAGRNHPTNKDGQFGTGFSQESPQNAQPVEKDIADGDCAGVNEVSATVKLDFQAANSKVATAAISEKGRHSLSFDDHNKDIANHSGESQNPESEGFVRTNSKFDEALVRLYAQALQHFNIPTKASFRSTEKVQVPASTEGAATSSKVTKCFNSQRLTEHNRPLYSSEKEGFESNEWQEEGVAIAQASFNHEEDAFFTKAESGFVAEPLEDRSKQGTTTKHSDHRLTSYSRQLAQLLDRKQLESSGEYN